MKEICGDFKGDLDKVTETITQLEYHRDHTNLDKKEDDRVRKQIADLKKL